MKIRLAAYLQSDSIVDGEGIRTVIWTQGCPHACLGCHNPETWSFTDGELVDVSEVCEIIDTLEGQDGITFSGGDPFTQPKACAEIARYARSKGLNIWSYTGFRWEELIEISKRKPEVMEFLKELDVLVDGRFVLEQKSFSCIFRGSTNQKIIDVPKSLKKGKIVEIEKYIVKKDNTISNRTRQEGIFV